MWGNVLIWLGLIGATVLLGWLTYRAWHAQNKVVKWMGVIVSGLFTFILALQSVFMLIGMVKIYPLRSAPAPDLNVAASPEQIERGRHLANCSAPVVTHRANCR
jgi:hypothetical protein